MNSIQNRSAKCDTRCQLKVSFRSCSFVGSGPYICMMHPYPSGAMEISTSKYCDHIKQRKHRIPNSRPSHIPNQAIFKYVRRGGATAQTTRHTSPRCSNT